MSCTCTQRHHRLIKLYTWCVHVHRVITDSISCTRLYKVPCITCTCYRSYNTSVLQGIEYITYVHNMYTLYKVSITCTHHEQLCVQVNESVMTLCTHLCVHRVCEWYVYTEMCTQSLHRLWLCGHRDVYTKTVYIPLTLCTESLLMLCLCVHRVCQWYVYTEICTSLCTQSHLCVHPVYTYH